MLEFFQENENLILILGIVSAISFLGTLAFIPWFIIRIPADYFSASTAWLTAPGWDSALSQSSGFSGQEYCRCDYCAPGNRDVGACPVKAC